MERSTFTLGDRYKPSSSYKINIADETDVDYKKLVSGIGGIFIQLGCNDNEEPCYKYNRGEITKELEKELDNTDMKIEVSTQNLRFSEGELSGLKYALEHVKIDDVEEVKNRIKRAEFDIKKAKEFSESMVSMKQGIIYALDIITRKV